MAAIRAMLNTLIVDCEIEHLLNRQIELICLCI